MVQLKLGYSLELARLSGVIGPAGAIIQHQQQSGTQENITILPTICADGTSLAPTVIYKKEAFQTKWLQENPLNARYYSCHKTVSQTNFSHRMGYCHGRCILSSLIFFFERHMTVGYFT